MKATLTCVAICSFGILAMAQTSLNKKEELSKKVEIVLSKTSIAMDVSIKKRLPKRQQTARLYLFKNSRVKKELAFKTKKHKCKLA